MEFAGNVKPKAMRLKYVATAWLNYGNTMVAVMLAPNATNADYATPVVSKAIGAEPIAVLFFESGFDVMQRPPINN